jgi:anti-anti-sigma factor
MSTIANPNQVAPEANTFTVSLQGNILSTNAQDVRAQLTKALGDPRSAAGSLEVFELDVTRAQMIDSVGLNLIVWLLKAVRERRARLRLLVASVHVERTLQFTRLDQQAEVVRRG